MTMEALLAPLGTLVTDVAMIMIAPGQRSCHSTFTNNLGRKRNRNRLGWDGKYDLHRLSWYLIVYNSLRKPIGGTNTHSVHVLPAQSIESVRGLISWRPANCLQDTGFVSRPSIRISESWLPMSLRYFTSDSKRVACRYPSLPGYAR